MPLSPASQPRTPTYTQYEPHTPSSLRSSSPVSSPTSSPTYKASARRAGQYNATTSSIMSSLGRKKSSAYVKKPVASTSQWDGSSMRGNLFGTEPQTELPQNNLLRERFKQRCFERAQRAHEAKVKSGRKSAHYSSDGEDFDMDMDDDGEDGFINEEFYARILLEAERKRKHSYRVSFQQDVGSSFDPAMEDPVEWERDLKAESGPPPPSEFDEDEADELAALAEDEAYWEALGNTDKSNDPDALETHPPRARLTDDAMDMT